MKRWIEILCGFELYQIGCDYLFQMAPHLIICLSTWHQTRQNQNKFLKHAKVSWQVKCQKSDCLICQTRLLTNFHPVLWTWILSNWMTRKKLRQEISCKSFVVQWIALLQIYGMQWGLILCLSTVAQLFF